MQLGSHSAHEVFLKAREKASHDHWRSGASELLSAYPFVRRFAEAIIIVRFPGLLPCVQSFLRCCKVLDLLQDAKGGVTSTAALGQAIAAHLQKHLEVYGDTEFKPKGNFALHFAEQIQRDNMIYDCFVVERSHQLPKLVATAVENTRSFEKSVVARALLSRLRSLDSFDERDCLTTPQQACAALGHALGRDDVQISKGARVKGMLISPTDFLCVGDHSISLRAAISADGDIGLIGHRGQLVREESSSSKVFRMEAGLSCIWLGELRVRRAHAWCELGPTEVLVLLPDLR